MELFKSLKSIESLYNIEICAFQTVETEAVVE